MLHKSINKMNVAIVGATGYGGIQSVRLLSNHPNIKISGMYGNKSAGCYWNLLFPSIPLDSNLLINEIDIDLIAQTSDIALLALPNGIASTITPKLVERGIKIIDLSADYRFTDLGDWEKTYPIEARNFKRTDRALCKEAVYGLPELNSSKIKEAQIVSCPGCFPTSALLALLPYLIQGIIDPKGIIIDSKTGTSGGGREAKQNLLFSEVNESIAPYAVVSHRHTNEIEQIASLVYGTDIQVQFTPHLIPMIRGILSTVYGRLRDPGITSEDCRIVLTNFYRHSSNIVVLPVGTYPQTKWVRNTNKAYLSVEVDPRNGRIILMSAIDNLLKGQSGQAVQNINIMLGINENTALDMTNFLP
tara:strand:+ start:11285 stop:12364 length:1080 start_codon:yes stop_codon:yes gene_type:complete